MKRCLNIILTLVLASGILILPACGKSNQSENNSQEFNDNGSDVSNNSPGGFMRNNPDLYGEVKAVNGNNITISVLEMQQRNQMTDEERQKLRERMANSTRNPNNAENPNGDPDSNTSRRPRGGGFMGGEKKYTGETADLELSDDIQITTFDMGNRANRGNRGNGNNDANGDNNGNAGDNTDNAGNRGFGNFQEKQLSLADIKVGSIIQVWYKKDSGDKKEIQNIRVIQVPDSSNNQQNSNQQNSNQQNSNQQNNQQNINQQNNSQQEKNQVDIG